MTFRTMIYTAAIFTIGLACLASSSSTFAQGTPIRPNAFVDNRIVIPGGLFYIGGGVRYRNIQKFELSLLDRSYEAEDRGNPPFGPSESGQFGTAVGRPGYNTGITNPPAVWEGYPTTPNYDSTDDPRLSGFWYYDDGFIKANAPDNCFLYSPAAGGNTYSYFWPSGSPLQFDLGRIASGINREDTTAFPPDTFPTDDAPDPSMRGSFYINVPSVQLNGETYGGSDTLTFSYVLNGLYNDRFGADSSELESYYVAPSFSGMAPKAFADKIWTPSIELGIQASNYFDLFYNFSWYDLGHVITRTDLDSTDLYRYQIVDAFPFYSDDDTNPLTGEFYSNCTNTGGGDGDGDVNYRIKPDTKGSSGSYPTRTYSLLMDEGAEPVTVQEDIRFMVNTTAYESRMGGRSWVPLYGLGRIGASAGVQLTPILFEIITRRSLTTMSAIGPNYPAGTVLDSEDIRVETWRLNHGAFIGTDLELGLTRFYIKASAEYAYCKEEEIKNDTGAVNYNPGGFTATFAGGVRF